MPAGSPASRSRPHRSPLYTPSCWNSGLNRTEYGKIVLAACFVNDLATVLALGLKFSPFALRTLAFAGGSTVAFIVLPWLVPHFFRRYGGRPSELEAKLLLLTMFGLGG